MEMHTRESLLAIHGIDGSTRTRSCFRAWLSRQVKRIQDAERRRRDYATLMAMDERQLSDIGLTRADVIAGFEYGRWPGRRGRGG